LRRQLPDGADEPSSTSGFSTTRGAPGERLVGNTGSPRQSASRAWLTPSRPL